MALSTTTTDEAGSKAKPLRVMVVDDQSAVCDVVADSIRFAGFDVVGTASDGAAAVEVAARLKPDVVVMDIAMPRMNGVEAMRKMLAAGSTRRVLLMSGEYRSLGFKREDIFAAGAAAFIEKPFNVADLFSWLEKWAAEERG